MRHVKQPDKHEVPRHLTDEQRQKLSDALTPLVAVLPSFKVAAPSDGEAQGYAKEFVDLFKKIGLKAEGPTFIIPTSANSVGVKVIINDFSHVPPIAEAFAQALRSVGIPVHGGLMPMGADEFQMAIGSKP
jgi:hypothetical protein